MKKFLNRIITGFFVFFFGIVWICTTQYYVKSKPYKIVIYDPFGKESELDVRTKFLNHRVATSFIKEYQNIFPHLSFSIQGDFPEIKNGISFYNIFKKNHR